MFSKVTLRHCVPFLAIFSHCVFLHAQPAWQHDLSFDSDGMVRVGGGREEEVVKSLALLPDGKILAAGRYGGDLSFILARYQPNGQIDASFDFDGKTAFHLGKQPGQAKEIITLPDGRFVLGASADHTLGVSVFGLVRFNYNGEPDNTFGINGVAKSPATPDLYDKLNAIARQPDGKILAAGSTNLLAGDPDQQAVSIGRFTAAGLPDNSFGTGGMVRLPFPGQELEFNAVAVQTDGRIVAAGSSLEKIIVVRFEADGSLDSTFGINGVKFLQYSAAGKTRCQAVSLLPNGKILLGAWCWEYWLNNGAIAIRLLPDGDLDPTFHNAGMSFIHCNYQLNTTSMMLQNDGKIVLAAAGLHNDPAPVTAIFRYQPNGAPDSTFGQFGAWVNPVGSGQSAVHALQMTLDGKILAGGSAQKFLDADFALLRLQSNGVPDPAFGSGGLVCTDFGWGYDRAGSIHPRPGGKVLLAGNAGASAGNLFLQEKCILSQLLADGSPDDTFGAGGRDSFPGGPVKTVAFQADGGILVGTDDFWDGAPRPAALFRRLPSGGADSTFGKAGCVDSLFGPYNSGVVMQAGVLSDGRIVVAGSVNRPGTFRDFVLTCLAPDGSRDSSFGDNGFVLVDFHNRNDEVYGLAVGAGDKILLGGTGWNGGIAKKDVVVMRFLANGDFDDSWGQSGVLFEDFEAPVDENISHMAFAPGGKLMLAVHCQLNTDDVPVAKYDNVLARYHSDGSPDPAFGANGRVVLPITGSYAATRSIRQIRHLPSGKFVTIENLPPAPGDPDSFAVALKRYLPNGAVDTGDAAVSVIGDRWGKQIRNLAVEILPAEGIVWLAGSSLFDFQLNEDITLARYYTEPACLPLVVQSVTGKRLDAVDVSILPSVPTFACPAGTITTQCADATLCLCGKDTTFIVPYKNDNPLNGVSTFDMVLISRHILGLEPLNSPFKIIAADINQSKSVTTFDIVELRKLILGIYQGLPNNSAWRFVRQNHVFSNPANPFAQPIPERDTLFVFDAPERSAFWAVKTGDVNLSHTSGCNNLDGPDPRQSLAFTAAFCPAGAGRLLTVPVSFSENAACAAWQAALRFDASALELVAAEPGELEGMDAANFGLNEASAGVVRVLWYSETGEERRIEAGKVLFRLVFRAKKDLHAGEEYLSTDETVLACRAFRADGDPVRLSFAANKQPCAVPHSVGLRMWPNPVGSSLCFVADGETAPDGELFVCNTNGTSVLRRQVSWSGGSREFCLFEAANWPPGLYTWRFAGGGGASAEGKFLKQ